ncbi:hypothetical protein JTB14_024367 [Gonioctena quinquepunctata]|nr:hypothetical protein JTB14_024367 [Gonioctena quinquepunctata]
MVEKKQKHDTSVGEIKENAGGTEERVKQSLDDSMRDYPSDGMRDTVLHEKKQPDEDVELTGKTDKIEEIAQVEEESKAVQPVEENISNAENILSQQERNVSDISGKVVSTKGQEGVEEQQKAEIQLQQKPENCKLSGKVEPTNETEEKVVKEQKEEDIQLKQKPDIPEESVSLDDTENKILGTEECMSQIQSYIPEEVVTKDKTEDETVEKQQMKKIKLQEEPDISKKEDISEDTEKKVVEEKHIEESQFEEKPYISENVAAPDEVKKIQFEEKLDISGAEVSPKDTEEKVVEEQQIEVIQSRSVASPDKVEEKVKEEQQAEINQMQEKPGIPEKKDVPERKIEEIQLKQQPDIPGKVASPDGTEEKVLEQPENDIHEGVCSTEETENVRVQDENKISAEAGSAERLRKDVSVREKTPKAEKYMVLTEKSEELIVDVKKDTGAGEILIAQETEQILMDEKPDITRESEEERAQYSASENKEPENEKQIEDVEISTEAERISVGEHIQVPKIKNENLGTSADSPAESTSLELQKIEDSGEIIKFVDEPDQAVGTAEVCMGESQLDSILGPLKYLQQIVGGIESRTMKKLEKQAMGDLLKSMKATEKTIQNANFSLMTAEEESAIAEVNNTLNILNNFIICNQQQKQEPFLVGLTADNVKAAIEDLRLVVVKVPKQSRIKESLEKVEETVKNVINLVEGIPSENEKRAELKSSVDKFRDDVRMLKVESEDKMLTLCSWKSQYSQLKH